MSSCPKTHFFTKGHDVEVLIPSTATWHSAVVLKSPSSIPKSQLFVEFKTLITPENNVHVRERVELSRVRPVPPQELHMYYKAGDHVDVFYEYGWRKGVVEEILEGSKYLVKIVGVEEGAVVEQWRLRSWKEWVDGVWVPQTQEQKKTVMVEGNSRRQKLKLRVRRKASDVKFRDGTIVEVSSDEEGYEGAWYAAKIVCSLDNDKFLVEYLTLLTDDQKEALREEAHVEYIRPCPPSVLRNDRFKQLEQVDAWYNDGWWVGKIARVLDDFKYVVQFSPRNDEQEFEHENLRPHQDWVDGKWVIAPKENSSELELNSREAHLIMEASGKKLCRVEFSNRTKVEVKTDAPGFEGSWFTAKIVCSLDNDKFLIEYLTLRTDDETKPLVEVAHASYLRPCPPPDIHRTHFNLHQIVDAWHNEGWWIGHVSKVHCYSKYAVYFKMAGEELEFHHSDLRPHQEWVNGKWIDASKENSSELELKSRELDLIMEANGSKLSVIKFRNRTKVEVKSDISGFEGSWFTAKIVRSLENDRYVVEYLTLRTDDGSKPLNEEAHASCLRPCPPNTKRSHFNVHEIVDAWHNEGWWIGLVSKVYCKSKYAVYFNLTGEELEFHLSALRPHHEWINGKWIDTSKGMKV